VIFIPNRGDVIWISFDPQAGHEQSGRRPALVLSPASYNGRVGLALLCPITNQVKGYSFEVKINSSLGLGVSGVILADQVKSLDWRVRNATLICSLPSAMVTQTLQKVNTLLQPVEEII